MMTRKTFVCLLAVLLVNCFAFSVVDLNDPVIMVSWESADGQIQGSETMIYREGDSRRTPDDKNPHRFTIQDQLQKGDCDIDLTMVYDEDPLVAGAFAAANNSVSDLIFTITFTSPINPAITPSTLYGGSMSGSYTDTGKDGSILVSTVSPDPLYQGMIDGVDIFSIYPHLSSWTALNFGSGNIAADGDLTNNVGPQALSTISLEYKFLLSAGDSATMNGVFEVVPEPATLSILGLGGLLMLRKKKH